MRACLILLLWLISMPAQAQTIGTAQENSEPSNVEVSDGAGTEAAAGAREGSPSYAPAATDQWEEMSKFIDLYQPYVRNISFYQPMYFLVGVDPKDSKFQFSFKYRFFDTAKPVAQQHPWVEGIHFAYTQTSFWDLASDSKPFEDTSYKPELFYLARNIDTGIPRLDGLFVQSGLQHESNGLAGDGSRSTNFAYLTPIFIFFNENKLSGLKISPRFQFYLGNDDDTNPDLPDYRGYWDLGITFGKANSFIVDTRLHWADAGGSIQADVTYPLHQLFKNNVDLYIQVEYVNALAESLRYYNERKEAVRIGVAIVR